MSISITDLMGLVPSLMGAQQQPSTVINVGPQGVQKQTAQYGDPLLEDEMMALDQEGYGEAIDPIDGIVDGVEVYGDPMIDELGSVGVDFFTEFANELDRVPASGNPDSWGGILDRFRGAARSATGKTAEQLGKIATKVNSLVGRVNKTSRDVANLKKGVKALNRRSSKDARYGRRAYAIVQREFGKKNQYYRAALQAAQALPGVRALNLFESTQYDDLNKSFIELGDAIADWKLKTEADEYTLSAVSATPTTAENQVNIQEMAQAIDDIRNDMVDLNTMLVAMKLKEKATALDEAKEATLISGLAKITPSQITRKEEAFTESIIKYVFGGVSDGSGGLFNLSVG